MESSDGNEHLCMALELCATNLWHMVRIPRAMHGLLESAEALRLLRQAAMGLAHLHGLQITHGDVTLKNLLLSRTGQLTVAGMGTAFCAHGFVVPEHGIITQYARARRCSCERRPSQVRWTSGILVSWAAD